MNREQSARDLIGYGAHPPNPAWPNGARVAVQFVINYEEGGENNILNGDESSEAFVTEEPAEPYRHARNMSVESQYEYGSRAGFWRLHRLFTERGIPVTIFGIALALQQNPGAVAAMKEAEWEIASHGYRWINYQGISPDTEREHLRKAIATHTEATGVRPLGWYLGRSSRYSRRLVVEEGGFEYDSDYFGDDLPFWTTRYGRPHLVVPYTLDNNDVRFATPYAFGGQDFAEYLTGALGMLLKEGATAPKMMSIGLHCRIAGRPGRSAVLERFLDTVASTPGIWLARRLDIARHWANRFPHPTSN